MGGAPEAGLLVFALSPLGVLGVMDGLSPGKRSSLRVNRPADSFPPRALGPALHHTPVIWRLLQGGGGSFITLRRRKVLRGQINTWQAGPLANALKEQSGMELKSFKTHRLESRATATILHKEHNTAYGRLYSKADGVCIYLIKYTYICTHVNEQLK